VDDGTETARAKEGRCHPLWLLWLFGLFWLLRLAPTHPHARSSLCSNHSFPALKHGPIATATPDSAANLRSHNISVVRVNPFR
jgi:hypothetical protein